MSDALDICYSFDRWTERTGILDGSGLTWIARIPISLVVLVISVSAWLITRNKTKEAN